MCLKQDNIMIYNKQQKGGELICGVSYLIVWYESRVRALARMDFKPIRRPGPSKCFSLKLHDKLRSPLSKKQAWNFRKPYRQRSCSRGPDHR
jgi:hypothetical protein